MSAIDAKWLMGFDLGGGGIRCVLVDVASGDRVESARPWSPRPAPDTGGFGFDLALEEVWTRVGEASREALARAAVAADAVAGVATAAMRFATVLVDAQGEALFAVPNRDARAAGESARLASERGEALHRTSGMWPLPIHASARLAWLAREKPEVLERADALLALSDWLNLRLCGARVTDPTQAGCTGLFDLARRAWSDEQIEALGLPRAIFPEVAAPGSRLGGLSADAAAHLGLAAGTAMALGAGDTRCGLLGAGVVGAGEVAVVAGTTAPIERTADAPLVDPEGALRSGHHAVSGVWVLEANAGPVGESLAWLARLFHPNAANPEARFVAEAAGAPAGASGMLSTFGVQIANDRALGLPVGELSLCHGAVSDAGGRASLARSVLEGYACGMRANLEHLAAVSGETAERIHLGGGLSRSEVFARVLAGITGTEVWRADAAEGSGLGAALCAGVGAGVFADLAEAAAACVKPAQRVEPDEVEAGERSYALWRELRDAAAASTTPVAVRAALPWVAGRSQAATRVEATHRPKLLVTAAFDDASLERLRTLGDVEYASFRESFQMLTGPSLVKAVAGRDVFVTEVDVLDAAALAQLPELRVVAACRGDAVNVDVAACTAYGIPVLNAPGRNADAVADLTLAFALALARRLPEATAFLADPSVTAGNLGAMGKAFRRLQGDELGAKTFGLVGLGAVGRKVARRLEGFGARVLVADPFVSDAQAALVGAEKVELEVLLRESDFVSLHAAVTDATRGFVGADAFAAMKPGAFLINTARAALVDEVALERALESGGLGGAALDAFAVEPPGADHPLVRHERVIHTPHVGGNTEQVAAHQGRGIADALEKLLRGEAPANLANPEVLAGFAWDAPRRQPSEEELAALAQQPGPAVSDLQRDENAQAQEEDLAAASAPPEIVEQMTRILERFTENIAADEKVKTFSADQDVALYFVLPDLGIDFHIALRGGDVSSSLGRPEGGSVVQLRMRSEIFDGMFTGKVNAMERAMAGDIAFTGDAAKAMAVQQMQSDMRRAYKAAVAELGEPGDLSKLVDPAAAGQPAKPVPAGEHDVREDLVAVTRELYEQQVITATGGNVCVRVPGADDQVWITPSQLFKGDLSPEVLVRIDLDGQPQDGGTRSASSEWSMHTQILKKKPEAKAVIHAHAPHATTLANAGLPFLPISTEAAFFGDIPRVPFIMPGTEELAEAVSEAMRDSWAVLMINHGLVVCGRSLRRAADMVEIVERSAELILGCHAVGKEPPVLPEDAVKTLRAMGDLVA